MVIYYLVIVLVEVGTNGELQTVPDEKGVEFKTNKH